MPTINLVGYRGSNQAANPRLLAEQVGVQMVDAEPGRSELRALRGPLTVASVPASPAQLSIYRMGRDTVSDTSFWLSWSTRVDVARGFDGGDTTERTYFTGSGSPKWTDNVIGLAGAPYPTATRELAVPAPTVAATTVLNTDGPSGTASTIFYVHTFVNDLGWESAPSPPSVGLAIKPGATVDISALPAAPAGNYGITLRRIYRTQADASGQAQFFFLREIAIASTTTQDDARALGDLLATDKWIPPPADAYGIIALWNGMHAVLSGKTVHISEVSAPYAYKPDNEINTLDVPVASAKWDQNLLVLTTGRPVLIQGQDPSAMSDTPLTLLHPCVSPQSVVAFGHGVVWASNEGLAYAGASGQMLLTGPSAANPDGVLTARQWRALVPSTMVAGRWGRMYVCSYNAGAGRVGFMFDPLNPADGITYLSFGWTACWYDELADQLFILQGANIRKFDADSAKLTADFTSKRFMQTAPVNFSHAKVVADTYPVTMTVTARWRDPESGAQQTHTEAVTVTNDLAFTLESGFLADDWQVRLQCAGDVQAARLTTDVRNLRGG